MQMKSRKVSWGTQLMKCRKVDSIISSQVLPAIHMEGPAVVVVDDDADEK